MNNELLTITKYDLLGKLPDPFLTESGKRISDPAEWSARRAEIAKSAIELQYGKMLPEPEFVEVETLYVAEKICGYLIHTGTKERPLCFRMQVLLPSREDKTRPFPVIVDGDQCWMYHMDRAFLNAALDQGIGWVFFDRTELAPDLNRRGRQNGAVYRTYPDSDVGVLGAWAWGYSRCVDALEQIDLPIDLDWIAFSGHSRGGKTAALAGALDQRARIVNPNATCAGACGCYRIHMEGEYENGQTGRSETLKDLWNVFSFWMGPRMGEYAEREAELPFDTHFLKAMVAPRTLFISEAAGDFWANPVGSWQTTMAAKEVFKFLGAEENLFWYFRPGTHAHAVSDVEMLVNIIRHQRDGKPLDERFFQLPFSELPLAFDWKAPDRERHSSFAAGQQENPLSAPLR